MSALKMQSNRPDIVLRTGVMLPVRKFVVESDELNSAVEQPTVTSVDLTGQAEISAQSFDRICCASYPFES